jgi:hypothetical protein
MDRWLRFVFFRDLARVRTTFLSKSTTCHEVAPSGVIAQMASGTSIFTSDSLRVKWFPAYFSEKTRPRR